MTPQLTGRADGTGAVEMASPERPVALSAPALCSEAGADT